MKTKKRFILLVTIVFGVVIGSFFTSNAATFDDINSPSVFFKQAPYSDTCTLAASVMMVRRAAMATGNSNWGSITEASMRSAAWSGGLLYNFTYAGISVKHAALPGGSGNISTLISLLNDHPEGVVIYDRDVPHAILLTDYTNGTFYCADPSWDQRIASGRIPISSASISVNNADDYWYVASPKVYISKTYLPQGCVDLYRGGVGAFAVSGWAFDRDNVNSPVSIHVYIDDTRIGILTANEPRTDVNGEYPGVGDYHGFSGYFTTSLTGSHRITVWAIDIGGDGTTNVKLGSEFVTITECNHNWGSGEVTKEPSCTEKGVRTYTCSACGKTTTKDIPANGHKYVDTVVLPSVNRQGYTLHECSVCQYRYFDNYTDVPEKNGPVITDVRIYNVTRDGYDVSCKVSDESGILSFTTSGDYVYIFTWTDDKDFYGLKGGKVIGENRMQKDAATGEYTKHINRVLKDGDEILRDSFGAFHTRITAKDIYYNETQVMASDVILREDACTVPGDHDWGSGSVTKAATSTTTGVRTYTCSNCKATRTEEIPATGSGSGSLKPTQSGTSTTPQTPTQPGTSTTPQTPIQSGTSTTPQTPTQSGTSATPQTPSQSGTASTPKKPSGAAPTAAKQLPVGTAIKNIAGGNYKVTGTNTVAFTKPTGKKSSVYIPTDISVNGVVYRVTSIAANAFKNDKKLRKVTIGAEIEKIGANAFRGCKNLKQIYVDTKKLKKSRVGKKAFAGISKKAVFRIISSKVNSYKKIFRSKGAPSTAKYKIWL